MAEQLDIVEGEGDLGGTMRLGIYPAKLAEGSIVREVYDGQPYVEERHRHRYEVNNAYRAELEKKAGLVFSGTLAGQQARRVRRVPARGPPLPGRHPGAPGAALPPDPAAPALRRPGEGRGRAQDRRVAAADSDRIWSGGPEVRRCS